MNEARHIKGMNVVADPLAVVTENLVEPAFDVAT